MVIMDTEAMEEVVEEITIDEILYVLEKIEPEIMSHCIKWICSDYVLLKSFLNPYMLYIT